jgi:hypothetical protein
VGLAVKAALGAAAAVAGKKVMKAGEKAKTRITTPSRNEDFRLLFLVIPATNLSRSVDTHKLFFFMAFPRLSKLRRSYRLISRIA